MSQQDGSSTIIPTAIALNNIGVSMAKWNCTESAITVWNDALESILLRTADPVRSHSILTASYKTHQIIAQSILHFESSLSANNGTKDSSHHNAVNFPPHLSVSVIGQDDIPQQIRRAEGAQSQACRTPSASAALHQQNETNASSVKVSLIRMEANETAFLSNSERAAAAIMFYNLGCAHRMEAALMPQIAAATLESAFRMFHCALLQLQANYSTSVPSIANYSSNDGGASASIPSMPTAATWARYEYTPILIMILQSLDEVLESLGHQSEALQFRTSWVSLQAEYVRDEWYAQMDQQVVSPAA